MSTTLIGILIPFLGTVLGAGVVFFVQKELDKRVEKAFLGFASGVMIAAGVTVLMSPIILPALPYLMAFAAGAMFYVVVEELIPESQAGKHSNIGTVGAVLGFTLMMLLDCAFG